MFDLFIYQFWFKEIHSAKVALLPKTVQFHEYMLCNINYL